MASLLVTSRQYFGDPIDCIVDDVPGNVMVRKKRDFLGDFFKLSNFVLDFYRTRIAGSTPPSPSPAGEKNFRKQE